MTLWVRMPPSIAATITISLVLLGAISSPPAQAQTFAVIHNFAVFPDGSTPQAGLTMDRGGNLYGTASSGGDDQCSNGFGCGTVFRLKHAGSGWVLEVLQTFTKTNGFAPVSRVVFGPDGALYGTTQYGGSSVEGTVFRLTPPPNPCHAVSCPWRETLLHEFAGGSDGAYPLSAVLFDPEGNLYATTESGGLGYGTVYQLKRSGNSWTYSQIYNFGSNGDTDGASPYAGLIRDQAGNLYGTTQSGGIGQYPDGVVYQLTPSGGAWQESILHYFTINDEGFPIAGLIFDQAGNLFGATPSGGGMNCYGTVFELAPSNGGWNYTVPYCFPYPGELYSPQADLTMDSAGNLYGTARYGGNSDCGGVFKLSLVGAIWTQTILHEFQSTDGCEPMSTVLIDANGNLYGTARRGGSHFSGVVWEITP